MCVCLQSDREASGNLAYGLGFRIEGLGFRVEGLGFGVQSLGFGV